MPVRAVFAKLCSVACAAIAALPKGIKSKFFVDRQDMVLESAPFAAGGFAQIFRGTYKGVPIALKEIHQHLVATPERCVLLCRRACVCWGWLAACAELRTPRPPENVQLLLHQLCEDAACALLGVTCAGKSCT